MEHQQTIDYWRKTLERRKQFGAEIPKASRGNWWDSPVAVSLYRNLYRLSDKDRNWRAPHLLLSDRVALPVGRGISFGCGSGHKELAMIKNGLVNHFTLVDVVPELGAETRKNAAAMGISDRVEVVTDSYESFEKRANEFDLVYWDNALHHMYDVHDAIRTSCRILKTGGIFLMDDFVGATYNQHGEEIFQLAEQFRWMLPIDWFDGENPIFRNLGRVTVEQYKADDPSESADSGRILGSLAKLMGGVEIIPMGGILYTLALRQAFSRLDETNPDHVSLLRYAFEVEHLMRCQYPHMTLYAMAFWRKPKINISNHFRRWQSCIPRKFRNSPLAPVSS